MEIIVGLALGLLVLGILENVRHQRYLSQIAIRIHINGTRGKSTTTRLIAGILRQAGYRVIAKTTGTAARIIWQDGREEPIKRRGKPSIIEQVKIVSAAARRGCDVLVIECMAVNPEMQWVSEKRILESTIGVITNAREDHLDVMGTTREGVASALALFIPTSAQLVVGEEELLPFFQEEARKLATTTHFAGATIADGDMGAFPYMMFKENVACALKVAELLDVPASVAWQGMVKATPDLGSTQINRLTYLGVNVYFVNAFAANDSTSTVLVWERWQAIATSLSLSDIPVIGLLHNRADRSFRVPELVELTCSELPLDYLWLTGDLVPVTKRYLKKHGFDLRLVTASKRPSPEQVLEQISHQHTGDVVLIGYGNTQGFGQILIDYFERNGERVSNDHTGNGVRSSY